MMNQREAERRTVLIGVLTAYGYNAPDLETTPQVQLEAILTAENALREDDGGAWDGDDCDGGF